ncbi:hypothetical protein QBC36DRAFT_365240 [Triangularia setosa]|uniref:Uncharacterized protein n=1 Tax=Triangularia setosa TaxID=2587417 RepID=A0AAN6VXS6_9PEZI|nr:hypothetical protein QBC36DRAFT_365240 [Podospora setosa]
MANNGTTTQALLGAFTFGSVVYAASAALVLYINGHGAAVFRDSQRLVLVSFLISSALWAAIDFVTTLLDTTGPSMPCQIGVIFASIFDQLARFSIEQFLLWALHTNKGGKLSVMQLLPQILVLTRFLAGAVFVGFTRPQTDDFCLTTTSALPVGVAVLALDAVIIVLLIQKAYSSGGAARTNSKSLTSVLLGLICWTAASIVMLLGITTIPPAARTALPAGGLLVLIVFVTAGAMTLITSRKSDSGLPEAPSPRRINISRDISTADSEYPPSRYEDLKEANIRSSRSFVNPREVPSTKDETSVGFPFAMSVATQGVPAMPPPVSTEYVRKLERSASQKKPMWDFGKRASAAGGRPVIGRPVLQNDEDRNPLNKITVIDLQEAAMADKERRQTMIGEEGRQSMAHRSVIQSMHLTPEEGVKRAASMKRKEVASVLSHQSAFPGGLQADSSASTTSAQLSPGSDETRRRSPRQPGPEEQRPWTPEKLTPAPQPARAPQNDVRPVTVLLQANVPQPIQRPDIRPSRMLPPSPDTPPPEATKTPLQRRPTIGLPTNPRARGIQIGKEAGASSQHKTIMFVNNIEYHDPVAVENIMSRANTLPSKPAPTSNAPTRVASVVNRPRPIPRKPENSPANTIPSPSHRRSKSAGSLLGRKSILNSTSGSPTQLPPLPPAPKSVALPARPQPNNTKSMTFDEKMTLLFPAPPRSKSVRRRSSSVPELPQIPKSYLHTASSPTEADNQRLSNRTTKTSVRTESVLEVDEIPRKASAVKATDEASKAWLSAFEAGKQNQGKRKSSPVIPPVRASAWTETTVDDLGTLTNWSSMNSPEYAMPMAIMPAQGLPAAVQMPTKQAFEEPKEETRVVESRNSDDVPFMLDTSTFSKFDMRKSWLVDGEVTIPAPEEPEPEPVPESVSAPKPVPQSQWHRRVGDECPAFSKECMSKKGCRKTPPTPLSLSTPNKKAIVVQAELSPVESPEQALQQIRAQLKKLDQPDLNAETPSQRLALLENLEKEMGMQVDHWKEMKHDIGRDSLSSIQTSSPAVKRDSVSSVANIGPRSSSNRLSIGSDRRASRLARLSKHSMTKMEEQPSVRNSGSPQMSKWQKRLTEAQMEYMDARLLRESSVNFLQLTRAQLASPTPPESDVSSNADVTEEVPPVPAQFLKHTPEPSPKQPKTEWLWTPPPRSSAPAGLLWTAPAKVAETDVVLPRLSVRPMARKELAPLQIHSTHLWRKPYTSASRSATGLWKPVWASAAPPAEPVKRVSQVAAPQPQKAPRPVTQRPPRRNKRVTLLPDIIENPEPLPDKRGTLGIFQFPWGEKSDTASIQARPPVLMPMPGTMTSGGPVRPKQQIEPSEYSSSFFDDYDDEDDVIDGMNSDEEGSDDGFDETTLWEIASLLKVDNVPSRNSLVPSEDSILGDYVDELESDDEDQSSREQSIVIGLAEPSDLVLSQKRDSASLESSTLMMLRDAVYEPEAQPQKPVSKPVARIGLPSNPRPAPPARAAESQVPASPASAPRQPQFPRHPIKSTKAETAVKQVSAGLWSPPVTLDKDSSRGGLFAVDSNRTVYRTTTEEPAAQYMSRSPRPAERKPLDNLVSTSLWTAQTEAHKSERSWIHSKSVSASLWTPPITDRSSSRRGLFVVDPSRTVYRTTTEEPAAQHMSRSPRPAGRKPLDKLTSTSLWTVAASVKTERNWISTKPVPASTGVWSLPVIKTPSPSEGLFSVDPSRAVYRTTTEEPAARSMSRSPRPVERKPLGQLKSTSLWTPEAATKAERSWIHGEPTAKKTARLAFSLADWRAALNEAIAASYFKATRISATAADWDAALQEAIALAYPSVQVAEFDSSVRHPVFAARSLITRSEWFHPAATGYTYDVANVHPVFFGSLAITCPLESVHPAISSYAAKKLRRQASKSKCERSASTHGRRDTIQAQIEALEQERIFAQQFAQAEYRRRTTSVSVVPFPPPPPVPVEEPAMATTFETVQDIQRRLSHRIRESLIISRQATPEQTPVSTPARAHSRSKSSGSSRSHKSTKPKSVPAVPTKPAATLWTPPVPVAAVPSQQMWAATKAINTPTTEVAVEDAESAARRQKGRKMIQKKARKVEILGQIRAVKRGEDPFERFEGMTMWTAIPVVQEEKREEKDWLHTTCVAQPTFEVVKVKSRRRTSVSQVPIPERKEVVTERESWRVHRRGEGSKGSKVVLRY